MSVTVEVFSGVALHRPIYDEPCNCVLYELGDNRAYPLARVHFSFLFTEY